MITELGTWFGLITAACTMLIALTSLAVMVVARRTKKTVEATADTANKTHQQTIVIHQLVNQRFTDMERYQVALLNTLRAAGIEAPDDQSKLDTTK